MDTGWWHQKNEPSLLPASFLSTPKIQSHRRAFNTKTSLLRLPLASARSHAGKGRECELCSARPGAIFIYRRRRASLKKATPVSILRAILENANEVLLLLFFLPV